LKGEAMFEFWFMVVLVSFVAIGCIIGVFYNFLKKNKCGDDWVHGSVCLLIASLFIFLLCISPSGYAHRIEEQKVLAANPTCEILRYLGDGKYILWDYKTEEVFKYTLKE
jgi:hypothetical protein